MSSSRNGVQAKVAEKYPNATFVHCRFHVLNLAISSDCKAMRSCDVRLPLARQHEAKTKRKRAIDTTTHKPLLTNSQHKTYAYKNFKTILLKLQVLKDKILR